MFDKKRFIKDIKAVTLIALFIFLLACINLFAKTNEQLLSVSSMEMSGYVGVYNDRYDEVGSNATDELKQIVASLENDKDETYQREFYILDKATGNIIATGDVPERVREELNSQVNEKMIIIDGHTCKVVDFDHYKLLVKVNSLSAYNEYVNAISNYALITLITLVFAFVLIALGQIVGSKRKGLHAGINIAVTLIVVAAFAFEVLYAETNQLETMVNKDAEILQTDLEYLCNNSPAAQHANKTGVEEIANSMANSSATVKDVTYVGSESHLGAASSGEKLNASQDVQISKDEDKIQNEKTNFYIQAALLLLLAFVMANEMNGRRKAEQQAKDSGAENLTPNDQHVRTIMMLVGLATSCFGIINVLRIRQVVMMNWTDNTEAIIGAIFTAAMIATILGSLISSTILNKSGSVKTYVVIVCGIGLVGSVACGISNNIVVFIVGLLMYNITHATSRMTNDFYATLIDDPGRKDHCNVEFSGGLAIGEVVGTIAGGIISVVVSFAFVQVLVGVIFLCILVYTLRLKGEGFATKAGMKGGIKEALGNVAGAVKFPSVVMFLVFITMMSSVPYQLVLFKLPLDIAALGLSAVVLSFIKTLQDAISIYSRPLFHVFSKRMGAVSHAALYVMLCGVGILVYALSNGSLLLMGVAVGMFGFLHGAGNYAVTKAFRELPDLEKMPESDRLMVLRLSQKAGDTVSPSLLTAFQNAFVLPAIVMALPAIYWVRDRFVRQKKR